ncbi:MAG: 3-oxoacyl-ACP reductase [Bacillus thermozeamaize]|uniref:3-oxoacyl-ACP reductase n=1 Tax=Bacillus thermozeamaize TaxID=230954 RepID=A0A1Y3PU24_9BACI|nr:MAG: 3-oxoacyl-ACP reductase [Bacillus thermozeamaize]
MATKAALVTGASSGIGLEIVKTLLAMGHPVYGLARDFSKTDFAHERFWPIPCDITRIDELRRALATIRDQGHKIHILVNNAGVGFFGPHEQLRPEQIEQMVLTNLAAPLVLTQMTLRQIKETQGVIINLSSITAKKSSTHGCAYAATKAGLTHFGVSLFDEIRKTGARVITIHPDLTTTPFYDHLDFRPGDHPGSRLTPESVAEAVRFALSQPAGAVVTDITLRPQRNQIVRKTR